MAEPARKLDDMIAEMLAKASAYCEERGITLTRLGVLIMNDSHFFRNLQDANNCTIKTYRKVIGYVSTVEHKTVPNRNVNECRP